MAASAIFGTVGAAASLAGGFMGAQAAQKRARAKADAAGFNAAVADRNAVVAVDQANRDAEMQQRGSRSVIGLARANVGASGVTADGAPLDVLQMMTEQAELDRQTVLYKGRLKSIGYQDEARLHRMSAESALEQGEYESASAILTGVSQAGQIMGQSLKF